MRFVIVTDYSPRPWKIGETETDSPYYLYVKQRFLIFFTFMKYIGNFKTRTEAHEYAQKYKSQVRSDEHFRY